MTLHVSIEGPGPTQRFSEEVCRGCGTNEASFYWILLANIPLIVMSAVLLGGLVQRTGKDFPNVLLALFIELLWIGCCVVAYVIPTVYWRSLWLARLWPFVFPIGMAVALGVALKQLQAIGVFQDFGF